MADDIHSKGWNACVFPLVFAAVDYQPSLLGEQWQPWELRGKKEKLEYRDCQQQRRSHYADYGG